MIELRRLHAFAVTVEEGHITRAAERLGMQQPPLSRLLQGLEAQLGCRLLKRLPRGIQPTEAGMALMEEAQTVLARASTVEDAVRRAGRGRAARHRLHQLRRAASLRARLDPALPGGVSRRADGAG